MKNASYEGQMMGGRRERDWTENRGIGQSGAV